MSGKTKRTTLVAATSTRTLVLKGKREASQNRSWPNEITLAAPDRFLLVATMPQATVRQIINGDKGWVVKRYQC